MNINYSEMETLFEKYGSHYQNIIFERLRNANNLKALEKLASYVKRNRHTTIS